jgi:hypothetical protein
MEPGMRLIPDELLGPLSFAGDADDCRAQLQDLAQSGDGRVDEIILLPCPVPGQTSLEVAAQFAQDVFTRDTSSAA